MYCIECGATLALAAKYCAACGTAIAPAQVPPTHSFAGAGLAPPLPPDAPALASFGRRAGAWAIDLGIVVAAIVALVGLADATSGTVSVIAGLVAVIGPFAYVTLMEGLSAGQTIGKRVLGLRVVRADGSPLGLGLASGRSVARLLDCGIGLLLPLFDPQGRTVHDRVTDTRVVLADPASAWPGTWDRSAEPRPGSPSRAAAGVAAAAVALAAVIGGTSLARNTAREAEARRACLAAAETLLLSIEATKAGVDEARLNLLTRLGRTQDETCTAAQKKAGVTPGVFRYVDEARARLLEQGRLPISP